MFVELPAELLAWTALVWVGGPDTGDENHEAIAAQTAEALYTLAVPACKNGKTVLVVLTDNDAPTAICLGDMTSVSVDGTFAYVHLKGGERLKLTIEPSKVLSRDAIMCLLQELREEGRQVMLCQKPNGEVMAVDCWELPRASVTPPFNANEAELEAKRHNLGLRDGMTSVMDML